MTLRTAKRLAVKRNQPIQIALKGWDLNFKAEIWITPHGETWARKKNGSKYIAFFRLEEALSHQWEEVCWSENLPTLGSANTQEDPTAPL